MVFLHLALDFLTAFVKVAVVLDAVVVIFVVIVVVVDSHKRYHAG